MVSVMSLLSFFPIFSFFSYSVKYPAGEGGYVGLIGKNLDIACD
jgi:hypothetical protein